jgi:hypothetical protein
VALFMQPANACYTIAEWDGATGSCDCVAATCTVGGPLALKTVQLTGGVTLTTTAAPTRFDFEPVRGALASATAASASLGLNGRSYTVNVTAFGRVSPFTP